MTLAMQILRLFAPDLGAADVLTGGQFFAVLRLVSHVLGGKGVDPSLVFVQGVCLCSGAALLLRASIPIPRLRSIQA